MGDDEQLSADNRPSDIAILFSGGRDSTLVALTYHRLGHYLHLLTFDGGLGYCSQLRELRLHELERVFGVDRFTSIAVPSHGLVRRLCFVDLEDDIRTDGCQLILLGEFLAMITATIQYCVKRGINNLATGAAGYQASLPEQTPEVISLLTELCEEFGLELVAPLRDCYSITEVKSRLLDANLSSKSLEGSTLLADLGDPPPSEVAVSYVKRKLPFIKAYLSELRS